MPSNYGDSPNDSSGVNRSLSASEVQEVYDNRQLVSGVAPAAAENSPHDSNFMTGGDNPDQALTLEQAQETSSADDYYAGSSPAFSPNYDIPPAGYDDDDDDAEEGEIEEIDDKKGSITTSSVDIVAPPAAMMNDISQDIGGSNSMLVFDTQGKEKVTSPAVKGPDAAAAGPVSVHLVIAPSSRTPSPKSVETSSPDDNSDLDMELTANDTSMSKQADEDMDVAMEVEAGNTNTKQETTSEFKKEQLHSTRGRSSVDESLDRLSDHPSSLHNNRNHVDNVGIANVSNHNTTTTNNDISHLREKPQPQLHPSFLSDSLTEEERRTRTRYIPAIDGMHALRKYEVKADLNLCRGLLQQRRTNKRNADHIDMDDYDSSAGGAVGAEDSDTKVARLIELFAHTLPVPSPAFITPPIAETTSTSSGTNGDGQNSALLPLDSSNVASPRYVGSVTAFNPPRPPESVGAKKKHRMLRWERRPVDIEIDLHNYHKTVQRTREELRNAESELQRVLTSEAYWRRHFLSHIHNLNLEWKEIHKELMIVQEKCVGMAELLISKRRHRTAGAWNFIMTAFFPLMRLTDEEFEMKRIAMLRESSSEKVPQGIGGVGLTSFRDWDKTTKFPIAKIASAWLLPGDKVETPYGNGTVMAVFPPCNFKKMETPSNDILSMGSKNSIDVKMQDAENVKEDNARAATVEEKQIGPRAAVKLPYGIAFFNLASLITYEDPTWYSDSRLALRWKGITETALAVSGALDVQAMGHVNKGYRSDTGNDVSDAASDYHEDSEVEQPLLPFGSSMIPTRNGRGYGLVDAPLPALENEINAKISNSQGVLGAQNNAGIPTSLIEQQKLKQEHIDLQAEVLHLRNELNRSRRTRVLNERTVAATKERTSKMESLVLEMRADLKGLRNRLSEEVRGMGINEEQEAEILADYYLSLTSKDPEMMRTNKFARTDAEMQEDSEDDDMETENIAEDEPNAVAD